MSSKEERSSTLLQDEIPKVISRCSRFESCKYNKIDLICLENAKACVYSPQRKAEEKTFNPSER